MSGHGSQQPSAWVQRWAPLIEPGGRVLDLACGEGRHVKWLAQRGYRVDAVDRDPEGLVGMQGIAAIRTRVHDLELGEWPYPGEKFQGLIVTHYLHRPLFPLLIGSLMPGGVLIYETFALGNARFGRPSKPQFLLAPGELLRAVRDALHIVAYEDVYTEDPKPAMVQRICAVAAADSTQVWR